ncbi:DUF6789 family protein [Desulfolucanica intricata]|uniref:DUF6789 family protein n=1 Tax=Desulfolucanica intricata TaxID=1285191 RepID=UPI000AE4B248|nr:DUF6789 family protein [Desulfolucanica intricata]
MNINDRLARGFLAGIVGSIAMNIFNLISYYLGIAELRFLDWAAVVIYGTKPENIFETIFAQLIQIIFASILGIIFAYLIPQIGSINYYLRGWLYGASTWFLLYVISLLYKIELTIPLHVDTAASDFLGSSIYGLVLAKTLFWLDNKVKIDT